MMSIVLVTTFVACAFAGVIPVSKDIATNNLLKDIIPIHQHKTLATLVAELKGLEIYRHNELKKAMEDQKLSRNQYMAKYLKTLMEYDKRWFVYAVRVLDCLDIIDHPDGKSADEIKNATDTIFDFKRRQDAIEMGIAEIKALVEEEKDEVSDELLETHQMEVVTTAFQLTNLKLLQAFMRVDAQKSQSQSNSPYSRNYIGSKFLRALFPSHGKIL
nr:PREDICTED: uncharacterized protein LOC109035868 [Bemisia tabaci]